MILKIFQVDAFTKFVFGGNPAAVVPLEEWLPDKIMQNIAAENNLSETAFFVPEEPGYRIRWFTPSVEVNLCGHATLASSYVIFELLDSLSEKIHFLSRSGPLEVVKQQEYYLLDFPEDEVEKESSDYKPVLNALKMPYVDLYRGKDDFMAVLQGPEQVLDYDPDLEAIRNLGHRGLIISAPGKDVDFISRYFAPQSGIDEDPVTGSAHTTLIPYWAKRTGKKELVAHQKSERGGELKCFYYGNGRVGIGGNAVLYLQGTIQV
jgi:PhzF family phenazine biosynthesis protein